MPEEPKHYHLAFVGYEPEKVIPGTNSQNRIYFKKDTLHFRTRQEQMDFFENNEAIVNHIKTIGIFKMLLDRNRSGRQVNPLIELMPYYEGETGRRLYFDESREVDVGLGRFMKATHGGTRREVTSQRDDIAAMPELFKK